MSAALSEIRGVLFDKDGTLVDFERTWRPVYDACALAAADGDRARATELLELVGQDADGNIDPRSEMACGTLDEIWVIWERELTIDRVALDVLALRATVPIALLPLGPVFAALRGLRLGVATMDSTASARRAVEVLELPVDFVTGFDGGFGVKPGPGMVLGFCDSVGLEPRQVAMVGDTLHDLHSARAAGAMAIAVTTGASPRELLAPDADHVLESIEQLPALLGR